MCENRAKREAVRRAADEIGLRRDIPLERLMAGYDVELEHGTKDPRTDVTGDDPIKIVKIVAAHLSEDPLYYERLAEMEKRGKEELGGRPAPDLFVEL